MACPCTPGHQRTVIFDVKTTRKPGRPNKPGTHTSIVWAFLMCDHGPTHVDSLMHVDSSPDAASIDQLPWTFFTTRAVCLDVSHRESGRVYHAPRPGTGLRQGEAQSGEGHDRTALYGAF